MHKKNKNTYQKVDINTFLDHKPRKKGVAFKLCVLACAAIVGLLITVSPALSVLAASGYVQVTGDPVNVRSNAGMSYSVIGKAHKGDKYVYLSEKKDATGKKWYQIQFTQSKKGWIVSTYAKSVNAKTTPDKTSAPTQTAGNTVKKVEITGTTVNIRTGNGSLYAKLGVARKGQTYQYLGSAKTTKGDVWYKIQFSSVRTGWVTSKYSRLVNVSVASSTTKVTATTTTTKATTTTTTSKPTTATTTTTTKTTAATTAASTASSTVTSASTTAATVSTQTVTTTTTAAKNTSTGQYIKVTGGSVNIRAGAGASYDKLGTAIQGSVFPYLGSDTASNGVTWYRIQYGADQVGWLTSLYADITGPASPGASAAQNAVDTAARRYGAVGVQVAVIKNGKVTDTYHYGYATKSSVPMKDDSKIRVASISKVAVGMATLKMQEEGIVTLDEDIGNYWGANTYEVTTLRQLLTHTSYLKDNSYTASRAGTAAQLASQDYYRTTNKWSYNNYGVGIAGSTLEVASGQTLNSYTSKKFFSGLGIDAAFTSGDLINPSKLATLYYPNDSVARSVAASRSFRTKGLGANSAHFAGGLTISARDMAKLTAILANDGVYDGVRYLSADSVALMETGTCQGYSRGHTFTQCMPLRYQTNIYGQRKMYYHLGTAYGTLSYIGYNPETRNGVVVISTSASNSYDSRGIFHICADIANYFFNH